MRRAAFVAVLVMALAVTASGQTSQTPKKFLGGPLTIEDQGSFFVGGVQKVTEYAVVPGPPPPGAAAPTTPPPVTPQQITIGQMYVQFQIPAKKYGAAGRSSWSTDPRTPAPVSRRHLMAAKAGIRTSSATACRATSSIRPDAAARGSISRCSTKAKRAWPAATHRARRH